MPDTSSPGTALPTLNVLSGVPDDRLCEVGVNDAGTALQIAVPGTANILAFLPREFSLNLQQVDPDRSPDKVKLETGPILNHIGDADRCGESLRKVQQVVARSGRACFNHPSGVLKTTRDHVARLLEGIPGLRVPRVVRHGFSGVPALKDVIEREGLRYPLILRIAGEHGGISAVKVDAPSELDKAHTINAHAKRIYVTEFIDFKSKDGRYRKFRVAMVGRQLFLRHMIVGDQWLLHAPSRGNNTREEEARMIERFTSERQAALEPMFLEIAKRLDLDWFGIDFNIGDDFTVTLFEANACMNILANTSPSPNMWDTPIARIKGALVKLLKTPENWRHTAPKAERR
jgi:hypothetical protein